MLPKPTILHVDTPTITIEGASFRVTALDGRDTVAMSGRMYLIERLNGFGEWEKMKRVQSFTFHAAVNEMATLEIKYYDHDPSNA